MASHLTWDTVPAGYTTTLKITPDAGVTVSAHLEIKTPNQPDIVQELDAAALVPSWSWTTTADDQVVHMTIMMVFTTAAQSNVALAGTCRKPDGSTHQQDQQDQESGSGGTVRHSYLWVN